MLKTIYIHIGLHKTGSTAIQSFLYQNRSYILSKYGILYPNTGIHTVAHHKLAWSLNDKKNAWAEEIGFCESAEQLFSNLFLEAKKMHAKSLLLSSEEFYLIGQFDQNGINKLSSFLQGYDVVIIGYVRRQDIYMESLYNQAIKDYSMRRGEDFHSFVQTMGMWMLEYYERMIEWKSVLPHSKLLIRPYERHLFPEGDVVLDFLNTIGLDSDPSFKMNLQDVNLGLSKWSIGVLSKINQNSSLSRLEHESIETKLRNMETVEDAVCKSFFSPDERKLFLELFISSNERMFRELLNCENPFVISKSEMRKYEEEADKCITFDQNNIIQSRYNLLTLKPSILIFGDSHINYFSKIEHTIKNSYMLGYEILCHVEPGASVKGFGRRENSTLNLSDTILKQINNDDIVVLAFGQVDLELGIYYRQFVKNSKESNDEFLQDCISSYQILINDIKSKTDRIIIKGINMPVLIDYNLAVRYTSRIITENIDDESNREIVAQKLYQGFPGIMGRIDTMIKYNELLEVMSVKEGIYYFDINQDVCHPNGMVKEEYIPSYFDHHLVDSVQTRRIHFDRLKEIIKNILMDNKCQ